MPNRERGGPRINYHPRTRGSFVLPIIQAPPERLEYDDRGRIIRPVAGGSEDLPTELVIPRDQRLKIRDQETGGNRK